MYDLNHNEFIAPFGVFDKSVAPFFSKAGLKGTS
jgi:hypothetical protein